MEGESIMSEATKETMCSVHEAYSGVEYPHASPKLIRHWVRKGISNYKKLSEAESE